MENGEKRAMERVNVINVQYMVSNTMHGVTPLFVQLIYTNRNAYFKKG